MFHHCPTSLNGTYVPLIIFIICHSKQYFVLGLKHVCNSAMTITFVRSLLSVCPYYF